MTTNTPPSSPSSANKSSAKKRASKSKVTVESFDTSSSVSSVSSSTASTSRIIRFSGFEGESSLARPLLIDDAGLVPAEHAKSTSFALSRQNLSGKGKGVSLEGCTDRLDLIARSTGMGQKPAAFKYAIAIVPSCSSEAIRVWDAEVLTSEKRVKRLKEVEETDAARLGADRAESAASAALDYKTSQNLLGEAFGTRKRKQAIVSLEKNKVRADNLSQTANQFISQALADSKEEFPEQAAASALKTEDVMASSLLPPYDKSTPDVALIYSVSGLIPAECYKALPVEEIARLSVKSSKDEIEAIQYKFGIKDFWMNRILTAPRDDGNHSIRLLLFAHFLSSFRELKEAAINGPDGSVLAIQSCLFECPEMVIIDLLNRFADRINSTSANQNNSSNFLGNAKHKLPNMLRDKAILYILVILLHLDGFRVNVTGLAETFAMSVTKLVSFFKALGCTIDRPGRGEEVNVIVNNRLVPIKYARLTAPLVFPAPPKRQSKK